MNVLFYESPVGRLTLGEHGDKLKLILFADSPLPQTYMLAETPVLLRAKTQLMEYFAGTRREFDLPMELEGTPFRKKVWEALCTVTYGQTASYGDIAHKIGQPKACRAVGGANHHNPISIVVP